MQLQQMTCTEYNEKRQLVQIHDSRFNISRFNIYLFPKHIETHINTYKHTFTLTETKTQMDYKIIQTFRKSKPALTNTWLIPSSQETFSLRLQHIQPISSTCTPLPPLAKDRRIHMLTEKKINVQIAPLPLLYDNWSFVAVKT